ncbi:hypothetical protein [Ornithinimicrobium cerasi]|uniref:hypothetical protein n=1 Tax=Ornithinimicrobium cerasi TaxID=2248773 RepID=UPI000EFEDA15|nr:hypothetical protein [Ornithinimicrobium cerasi]
MPNTFDAVPDLPSERSTTFLPMDRPQERLEHFIKESKLQRGSLRWEDGYTIPFREGGSVRIRVNAGEGVEEGLRFHIKAPTVERREHIEQVITEQAVTDFGVDHVELEWTAEAEPRG